MRQPELSVRVSAAPRLYESVGFQIVNRYVEYARAG
jgi:ribosomal protein S18 acetylase RimI-like enzyme